MRRIFIDIGVMDGRSIRFFREHHPQAHEFTCIGFECLPANIEALGTPGFTLIPAAAWTYDGMVRFHPGKADGSSLIGTKRTGRVRPNVFIDVPCIDFARWLRQFEGAEIWLKSNSEGAEYGMIEHLHREGLIPWVSKWYMCWHAHKIGMSQAEHDRIAALLPKWYPWHPYGPGSAEAFRASLC